MLKKEGRIIDDPAAAGWEETSPGFWEYKLAPLVEEAPVDSKQYARQDAAWSEVVIPEVPEFIETDPTVPDHVKAISTDDIANWSASYSWGDHGDAGYATMMWVQSNYQIKGDYLTITDKLWNDISSEIGNNTIERFGDEVWVTNFRNADVFIGTKIGSGVETTGDVTAGNGLFSGTVSAGTAYIKQGTVENRGGSQLGSNNGALQLNNNFTHFEPSIDAVVQLGSLQTRFKDAYFSGTVNANAFVGDGSGLTGLPASGMTQAQADARYVPKSGSTTISGTLTATNFIATSDRRVKKNITTAPTGVLEKIRGVEFEWKASGQMGSGVISQELEAVPELAHLVHYGEEDGTKHVSYLGLIGYLIEEVKSLRAEIEELK